MSVISLATYIYKTYGPANSKFLYGGGEPHLHKKEYTTIEEFSKTTSDPHNYLKKYTGKPCYGVRSMTKNDPIPVRQNIQKMRPTKTEGQKEENPPKPTKNYILENINIISQMKPKATAVARNRYSTTKPLTTNEDSKNGKASPKNSSNSDKYIVIRARRNKRKILINRLNRSFEELEEIYQSLPLLTDDTSPIIRRKTKIEADLVVLEKEIDQFLRGKFADIPTHSKTIQKKNIILHKKNI